jgi:hypothetical protein
MYDEEQTFDIDPQLAMRFAEACAKAGINPRSRPITHFKSVAEMFHMLVNLPADLQAAHMTLEARHR